MKNTYCQVRVCHCGSVYVTIGATTLKMTPDIFASVLQTLNSATVVSETRHAANELVN